MVILYTLQMENKKIVEYYPSNEGLKNIYSKFLKFGSIEDLDNLILLYTNDIRKKVINSYKKTERMKRWLNLQLITLNISMENISNKRLIPIWFNDKEFALVEEEFLTEMNKQIERLLTTKTDTIKIIPEEWQWEVKL